MATKNQIELYNSIFPLEEYMHVTQYDGKPRQDLIGATGKLLNLPLVPFEAVFALYR